MTGGRDRLPLLVHLRPLLLLHQASPAQRRFTGRDNGYSPRYSLNQVLQPELKSLACALRTRLISLSRWLEGENGSRSSSTSGGDDGGGPSTATWR